MGTQSDLDVVVELTEPDLFVLIRIKQDLETAFQRHVDMCAGTTLAKWGK